MSKMPSMASLAVKGRISIGRENGITWSNNFASSSLHPEEMRHWGIQERDWRSSVWIYLIVDIEGHRGTSRPRESKWDQVNPSESGWIQVNPSESKWIQVNPSESKWVQKSPSESKWVQMSPSESKWVQVNPSESKWIQMDPSESKWSPPPLPNPPIQL